MTAITFDSLAYSKRLQQAGMPSEQADALAELTRQHDDLWLALLGAGLAGIMAKGFGWLGF